MNARQLKLTGSPDFSRKLYLGMIIQNSQSSPNPAVAGRAVFEFWMFGGPRFGGNFSSSGRLVSKLMEDEPALVGPQALPLDLSLLPKGVYSPHDPESNLSVACVNVLKKTQALALRFSRITSGIDGNQFQGTMAGLHLECLNNKNLWLPAYAYPTNCSIFDLDWTYVLEAQKNFSAGISYARLLPE